jgi:hypothetical protein
VHVDQLSTYLKGVSWLNVLGWLGGAMYFALIVHDRSKVAYCAVVLASTLLPSIVTRGQLKTLQSWLAELGKADPTRPPA